MSGDRGSGVGRGDERLTVKRGDRFVQRHPEARWALFIEVTRVARDGSWCDIRCCTWAAMWTKRMPEGIGGSMSDPASPLYLHREDWTLDNVTGERGEAVTIRRYTPIAKSRGTVIPSALRAEVRAADRGCVGPRVGMPGECSGGIELDHVRASHGMGMKSETVRGNLVSLCSGAGVGGHHWLKTNHARTWRPILLDYIAQRDAGVTAG